jgi:hypothetical protein
MRITRNIAILVSGAAVGATFFATPAFAVSPACSDNMSAQHMYAARMGQPPVLPMAPGQMRESVRPLAQPSEVAALKVSVKTIAKALQAATAEHANPEKVARLVDQAKQELDQLAMNAASAPNSASKAPYQAALIGQSDTISQAVDALKAALDQLVAAVTSQDQTQITQAVQDVVNAVADLAKALGAPISITPLTSTSIGNQSMPSTGASVSAAQQQQANGALANVPASPNSNSNLSALRPSALQQQQANEVRPNVPASPVSNDSQSMPSTSDSPDLPTAND